MRVRIFTGGVSMTNTTTLALKICDAMDFKRNGNALYGRIEGNYVNINVKQCPYVEWTDAYAPEGSYVFCEKGQGNMIVVVGIA